MAESAVEFSVNKIASYILTEASLAAGVRHEFTEIKRELESMKAFLKDADRKGVKNDGVRTWVEQVRDTAYDVEDIIDEFMYHFGGQRKFSGFMGFVRKIIHFPKNVWVRRSIASKLQDINTQIKSISERTRRYGFDHVEQMASSSQDVITRENLRCHAESALFLEDDLLVGIEKDRGLLLGWLMSEGESQRTVISVCGMGGSGKTTLVSRVYRNQTVKRHFNCYAWITVTQTYDIEDLFRSLIKDFFESTKEVLTVDPRTMNYRQLVVMLVNYLQHKRYLVILDDVWNTNVWKEISVALPDGGCCSRVLLTTRMEDIASFSFGVRSHVHPIQPLQEKEAWALFCKTTFSSDHCPPGVESVAHHIVDRCQGLPLAIVAMGGLMATKSRMDSEWRKVNDSLTWELSNNPKLEVVKSILLLSYNELPSHLKHCFLYCCVFPEDHRIGRIKLIRLWIAEGFVAERRGMALEDVAETYLMELIYRNLIYIAEKNEFGKPRACRMHDLMRDLALSKSEGDNFCMVYNDDDESKAIEECRTRRLSLHKKGGGLDIQSHSTVRTSQLRSLFLFNGSMLMPSGFRLLRVLDVQGVPIESLPDELSHLFNLRYLNLRDTLVRELPESIGRLQNMQTMDLRDSKVEAIPRGIVKLHRLRHLIAYRNNRKYSTFDYAKGVAVSSGDVGKLKNLQALHAIDASSSETIIKQIGELTQLKKLGITKVREEDGTELCTSIQKLKLLRYLLVTAITEEASLRIDVIESPPPNLQRLHLFGKLEKVPHWFRSLENLTYLNLRWSQLREDPLPYIQALPSLSRLTLHNAYSGQQWCFQIGWFPKLEILWLVGLPELSQIIIEEGALPKLQELYLFGCKELKMVPQGIEYLRNLHKLYLEDAPEEFIDRMHEERSADRRKVQHIAEIDHYRTTTDGRTYEDLSPFSVNG